MSGTVRLVLVAEHKLFRECLASMLTETTRFTVMAQFDDLAGVLELLPREHPDVVLVDFSLPTPTLMDTLREMAQDFPQVKVLLLGLTEARQEIVECIEAGASGYVSKESSLEDLERAIRLVLNGETLCPQEFVSTMFSRLADLARERRQRERLEALDLTPRELEILGLIAQGSSNQAIADTLFLSIHTVKNHVHRILEKLQVERRSEAVEHAYGKEWLRLRAER